MVEGPRNIRPVFRRKKAASERLSSVMAVDDPWEDDFEASDDFEDVLAEALVTHGFQSCSVSRNDAGSYVVVTFASIRGQKVRLRSIIESDGLDEDFEFLAASVLADLRDQRHRQSLLSCLQDDLFLGAVCD